MSTYDGHEIGALIDVNGVLHIITKIDEYGGYTAETLKEYVLKNYYITLIDGEKYTLNELVNQQIDEILKNKEMLD